MASAAAAMQAKKEAYGEMAMAVLASENEFSELFPECEVGAMPPSAISMTCPSTWQIRWQTMLRSPSTPATAAS